MLNCRLENAHQPLRIAADSHLRIPLDSKLCRTAKDFPTLIACIRADEEKRKKLEALGAEVLVCDEENGHVSLKALFRALAERQISSVMIEGGGVLSEAALRHHLVQHVYAYIAPKILGGKEAKTPVEGQGFDHPDNAALLTNRSITTLGNDILLEYDVIKPSADKTEKE